MALWALTLRALHVRLVAEMRLLSLVLCFLFPLFGRQQEIAASPEILSPQNGEAVKGPVAIRGTTAVEGLVSWEITFTYAGDAPETWFLLAVGQKAIQDAILTQWDTTTITDGNYTLRLRVYLTDGGYQDAFVRDVRVRNYTPVETATPIPLPTATLTPVPPTSIPPTPTVTPLPPTPTPLPPNPAALSRRHIQASVGYGALFTLLLFATLGAGAYLRRIR